MNKTRVGILISGRGSNMEALVQAAAAPGYPAEIAIVIANRPEAPGLFIARDAGVMALAIDHRSFGGDRGAHEHAIDEKLREQRVEIVCLAGYMRLLTPFLVRAWHDRMLNIHPSLLPELPGLHTHARALQDGRTEHGCTVHLVTDIMDEGPILAQATVPILPGDNEDSLAARVLVEEHRLYPATLAAFCDALQRKAAAP